MDKNIHISMLFEIYGKMLTEKQKDVIDLYYNSNLSLSEIAEELGITRQGVRKNLIESENKLLDFEQKLCFLREKLTRQEKMNKIIEELTDKELIEKIKALV